MSKGVSLHVGINKVSVSAFTAQHLVGCENDAVAMSNIALSRGFTQVKLLLGPEATFKNVDEEVRRAAALLKPGDTFLFTFAGHGSRIPNEINDESLTGEPDGKDEAIVLFNRLMLDDYMRRVLWPEFKEGVRIVGVMDSCHSATAIFALPFVSADIAEHGSVAAWDTESGALTSAVGVRAVEHVTRGRPHRVSENFPRHLGDGTSEVEEEVVEVGPLGRDRALNNAARSAHGARFKPFYEELDIPSLQNVPPVKADLLVMAACRDGEKTQDGLPNGAFTKALLKVWNNGAFDSNYITFMGEIGAEIRSMFPTQFPTLTPSSPPAFSSERPFTI